MPSVLSVFRQMEELIANPLGASVKLARGVPVAEYAAIHASVFGTPLRGNPDEFLRKNGKYLDKAIVLAAAVPCPLGDWIKAQMMYFVKMQTNVEHMRGRGFPPSWLSGAKAEDRYNWFVHSGRVRFNHNAGTAWIGARKQMAVACDWADYEYTILSLLIADPELTEAQAVELAGDHPPRWNARGVDVKYDPILHACSRYARVRALYSHLEELRHALAAVVPYHQHHSRLDASRQVSAYLPDKSRVYGVRSLPPERREFRLLNLTRHAGGLPIWVDRTPTRRSTHGRRCQSVVR